MAGIARPGFKANIKANMDSTKGDKLFVNIKPDTTLRVRFLPPAKADGMLFFVTGQHFKVKNAEGKPCALADRCIHAGDPSDYLEDLSRVLIKHGDDNEKRIGQDIRLSKRWNAQVLVAEKEDGEWTYFGPKIISLSKTTAEAVNQILMNQDMVGDDHFYDPDMGQDLLITRKGAGFDTKYSVDRTGLKASLDDVFPEWSSKFIADIEDVMGLNIVSLDEQKAAARRTYPMLDWEALEEDHDL